MRSLSPFLALCLAALAAIPLARAEDTRRVVTVSGTGLASARPDMAVVTAGVVNQAATAAEATGANSTATAAVIDRIKAAGIDPKDIQTSGFNLQPVYVYPKSDDGSGGPPRVTGYSVTNSVTVRVRDLARLGALLDGVVSAGANTINGINFVVSKESELSDRARGDAVADARRKAELYAIAAGEKLGPVVSISETAAVTPAPVPMLRGKAAFEAAAPPVEAGETELRVEISVTYELE